MGFIATITPNPLLCAVHVYFSQPNFITKSTLLPQHLISHYMFEEQIVGVADFCHSYPLVYPSDWWSNFISFLLLASWHQFLWRLSLLARHLPPDSLQLGKPYLYFFSVPFVSLSEPILGLFPDGDNWYLSCTRSVPTGPNLQFQQDCRGSILDQENVESRTGHSIDAYALTRANILVTCCPPWLAYRFCPYCA